MATEGGFPKVDGDILYASEANRFRPKFVGYNQNAGTVIGSGGTFVIAGSILYSGTYPHLMSEMMHCEATGFWNSQGHPNPDTLAMRFRISGPFFNFNGGSLGWQQLFEATADVTLHTTLNYIFSSGAYVAAGGSNLGSPMAVFLEITPGSGTGGAGFTLHNFGVWCA